MAANVWVIWFSCSCCLCTKAVKAASCEEVELSSEPSSRGCRLVVCVVQKADIVLPLPAGPPSRSHLIASARTSSKVRSVLRRTSLFNSLRRSELFTCSTKWSRNNRPEFETLAGELATTFSIKQYNTRENSWSDSPSNCFLAKKSCCNVIYDLRHPYISFRISNTRSGSSRSARGLYFISSRASPSKCVSNV